MAARHARRNLGRGKSKMNAEKEKTSFDFRVHPRSPTAKDKNCDDCVKIIA